MPAHLGPRGVLPAVLLVVAIAADAAGVPARGGAGNGEDVAAYLELVARYRRASERRGAVDELLGWSRESARDAARGLGAQGAPPVLRQAAMLLHGDAGILARRRGETELSEHHFRIGSTIIDGSSGGDPDHRASRWLLAIALFEASSGAVDDASAFLDQALERFPEDPQLLLVRGQIEEYLGTQPFRGWAPRRASLPGSRGGAEEAMRESSEMRAHLSEAEAHYRRALAVDPTLLDARLHLGRIQHVQGQLAEARESLEAVAGATPPEAGSVYLANLLLGGLEESTGELESAADRYRAAVDADPLSEVAVLALAHVTHRLGHRRESAEVVQALLSKRGSRPHTDGWWAFRMGPLADGDRVEPILREIRTEIAE